MLTARKPPDIVEVLRPLRPRKGAHVKDLIFGEYNTVVFDRELVAMPLRGDDGRAE